jgi:hypothetical protein
MTLLQCNVCKNNAPKFLTFWTYISELRKILARLHYLLNRSCTWCCQWIECFRIHIVAS